MFFQSKTSNKILLTLVKDDFTLTTWLYFGAFLQSILFLIYPYRVVVLPSILIILYRILVTILMQGGILEDPLKVKAIQGRHTAQVVNADGSIPRNVSENEIVVFILGSSRNGSARGHLRVEDGAELGTLFTNMWVELSKNPEKWGYLGKTASLFDSAEEHTNTTCWISYWRNLEDLQAFARSSSHMASLRWWSKKDRSGIGIMHETYVVPAGNWETIYGNMRPFGLAASKQPYTTADGQKRFTNGLIPSQGPAFSSMKARMGRSDRKPFDDKFYMNIEEKR